MSYDPHNPINTFLQIEVIVDIGSIIYIILFRFSLDFIFKNLLMKYHDKTSITSFWICSKNERLDYSSNVCFSLILYLAIIIVRIWDLNYLL